MLASDIVVLGRVVDPALALVSVERVSKGEAPKQITLIAYVDGFAVPAQRKPLMANARELLFLRKKDDAYAPVQDQYDRDASQLVTRFPRPWKNGERTSLPSAQAVPPKMRNDQRPPSNKDRWSAYVELLLLVHRDVVHSLTGSVRPRGRDGSRLAIARHG